MNRNQVQGAAKGVAGKVQRKVGDFPVSKWHTSAPCSKHKMQPSRRPNPAVRSTLGPVGGTSCQPPLRRLACFASRRAWATARKSTKGIREP
jgi:hypothetical protein